MLAPGLAPTVRWPRVAMPGFLSSLLRHVVLFLFCALLVPAGRSEPLRSYCPFTANYTRNSTFQSNLEAVLSSVSSRGPFDGFSNDTWGAGPDRVYGLALCRDDVGAASCQTCLNNAVSDVALRCGSRKTATVWYDECLLRYSDQSFSSSADTSYVFDIPNPNNVAEPQQFGRLLESLLDELVAKAVNRRPGRMFGSGYVRLNGSRNLHGLVQCTRDLSGDQCSDCLGVLRGRLPTCCGGKDGARLFCLNCVLRFETFPFSEESDPEISLTTSPLPLPAEATPASVPALPPVTTTDFVPGASLPQPRVRQQMDQIAILVAVTVLPALAALLLGISCYMLVKSRKPVANMFDGAEIDEIGYAESTSFDFRTLRAATNNFSYENKLGEGGFGPVYKGVLSNGQQIAIKMLSRSSRQGLAQLRNEVVLVAKLQHRNLVRLIGYCLEGGANLLVYEYLRNKSLDRFLFDPSKRVQLNWERRYKIIEGIARGLLYLHEDSRLKIIHRDLKAANILLDEEMNPKISDFGLAKLFGSEQSHGNSSRVVGTYGYMAPEYVNGHYSKKSDIYSFGIIVLEIITGRQSAGFHWSGRAATLTSYVWQHWVGETLVDVLDQSMVHGCSMEQVSRCAHIGLLCVQEDPYRRPTTASVVLMLSSDAMQLPTVSEPAFFALGSTATSSVASVVDQGTSAFGQGVF